MENLFSIIDVSKVGLMAERTKVEVHASNIANIHNTQYQAKQINFDKLMNAFDEVNNQELAMTIDIQDVTDEKPSGTINLDQEVAGISASELRYQTIAQAIQRKFGLLDLVIGGKNK